MSSPVCEPLLSLPQLPCKHDLFPPAYFSCQRFCRTYFVYSLINIYIPETHNNTANCLLPIMIANRISLTCSEHLKCRGSHLLARCPRHTASKGGKKNAYHTHLESYFQIKLKAAAFALQISPSEVSARYNKHHGWLHRIQSNGGEDRLLASQTPASKF